ncbi:MAG: hypothetical protein IKP43_12815 [Bacteroidaceae bacterium]|nr:hypothetical protein [Bacteroidaceae bacterium]
MDFDNMTDEQWQAAFDEFEAKYMPPQVQPIPVLDLIMKKENAQEIVKGKKRVEIRQFNDHYSNRLTDKVLDQWMTDNHDKIAEEDLPAFDEFLCSTRPVYKIHFHNYNNSWYLDVECVENALIGLTAGNIANLQERFDFHELDDLLEQFEERDKGKDIVERPLLYYFGLGEVLDTNLE